MKSADNYLDKHRPALIASHAMSLSSQINSDPRRLRASLQDFQFVVR